MSALTAAEAWCWASWMLGRESDAAYYRYPRTEADMDEAMRLRGEADACYARAVKLGADNDVWQGALAKWETP
jgi:hypothetical protein